MNTFKASEILQLAMKIEENGEGFYRHAKGLAGDAKMKDLFGFLAGEEIKHKKAFQDMASKLETYEPPESYPGEYFAYLRSYAENIVFSPKEMEKELARITDVDGAVEFAIQREIESILYYLEAKGLVPRGQQDQIDKIIDEEREHYLRLIEVKKGLD